MDFTKMIGVGVVGNFTGHLEQAGESGDFVGVVTAEENAPKGIFPFYLPSHPSSHLAVYPLSSHEIDMPNNQDKLQAEPEVAVICDIVYDGGKVAALKPKFFGAYNDCSIRRESVVGVGSTVSTDGLRPNKERAVKISDKKNWGANSKGIAKKLLRLQTIQDAFERMFWQCCQVLGFFAS